MSLFTPESSVTLGPIGLRPPVSTVPVRVRGSGWYLLAIVAGGFAVRLYLAVMTFASTFDTSTVGLMALHILKGGRPLFYYGQSYMGALEAYVAALLFALFGPSEVALALSPILFSLGWIAATYLLFRELMGERAGLAAALCVALPGWEVLWYNIGSYGGYPAAFCFGTLALWLSVRLVFRELDAGSRWLHATALGVVAALGLWTHYLSCAYLVTGAILLLFHLVRLRFEWRSTAPLLAGGLIAATGLLPALLTFREYTGEHVVKWNLSFGFIKHNVRMLLERNLPRLVSWPVDVPDGPAGRLAMAIIHTAGLLAIAVGALLYLRAVVLTPDRRRRALMLVPVLFSALFLVTYLPHALAFYRAPRYVIPLGLMMLCTIYGAPLAVGSERVRSVWWIFLLSWTVFNAGNAARMGGDRAPRAERERARRHRVAEAARAAGLKTVRMVGGEIFGHDGQTLSFYSGDKVRFVSVFDERYQPSAQEAEADPRGGLAVETSHLPKVREALEALDVKCLTIEYPWVCLLYDLRLPTARRRSIPGGDLQVTLDGVEGQKDPARLTDRVRETYLEGPYQPASGFTIDVGREIQLDSLWLYAPDDLQFGLPEGYAVSVSVDGQRFQVISHVAERTAVSYISGGQVYFKGYHGLLECRFPAVPARFVRVACEAGQVESGRWQISEVFVFERLEGGGAAFNDEADAIAKLLRERGVEFTAADRWLSARLLERLPMKNGKYPVFPRYNPKYKATAIPRELVPRQGTAIAVPQAVADECNALIEGVYGTKARWDRFDFTQYTIFAFTNPERPVDVARGLVWNGHTLLTTP